MDLYSLVYAFVGALRHVARGAPWTTVIIFVFFFVFFAYKFTDLPKRIKDKVWFEPSKRTPCTQCKNPAETYCVECKKVYCKFCCCLLHHGHMKTERHSIEWLVGQDNHEVITVILPDLLILLILGTFVSLVTSLSEEQILGASYCPVIQRTRKALVRWDPSVFYYMKAHFAEFCDAEDSAWRLYIDAWYRAVVTSTDSLFLIIVAFVKAFIFEKYIEFVLAKVMGYVYGLIAGFIRWAEIHIVRHFHALVVIGRFLHSFSLAKHVKAEGKPPPPTFKRKRPWENWVELWKYEWDRKARLIQYYKGHAQAILKTWLRGILYGAVFVRLVCVLFGADFYVRTLLSEIGMGDLIRGHQRMFLSATGAGDIDEDNRQQYFSEWLAVRTMSSVFWSSVNRLEHLLYVSEDVFQAIRYAMWPLLRWLFIPGLLFYVLRTLWTTKIKQQTDDFKKKYAAYKQDLYKDATLATAQHYASVKFKPVSS